MSLADIKAKITAEAQEQIKELEAQNKAHIDEITRRSDAEVKAIRDSYKTRLAQEEPEVLKRREIVAELDAKKVDLGVKQRLVNEAFDAALTKLADLTGDKYIDFVGTLMDKAVVTGKETVLVGQNEKHITSSWLDDYNAAHNTSLTLSDKRLAISGGFVLRNERIDINCSWEMLLKDIRPDIEPAVIKKMFP
ncbi:MAG: hypothetical protein GX256_06275 [Fretibacterium sp.]|nr:hypothetical protein [Fretibacterium sp.]